MEVVVSVIVPCYNQGEFIWECVNSLINQTFQNWECIIVNDGSTDNTHDVCIKLLAIDQRFKYIYQTNSGVCAARNLGIEKAIGEFILPLDADDYLSSNYLQLGYEKFLTIDKLKVVYGIVKNFGCLDYWGSVNHQFDFVKQLYSNQIHCSGLFRRADAIKINGYDVNMELGNEDWDFYIRLIGVNGFALQMQEIILYYRRKVVSRSSMLNENRNNLKMTNLMLSKNIYYYTFYNIDLVKLVELNSKLSTPEEYYSYDFIVKLLKKKILRNFKMLLSNLS
jgi:glycosyltransferase involved in cell wall biosynthesis